MAKKHRTLKLWLAIVLGSVLFSGALLFWNSSPTGMAAYSQYDTGPTPNFNPDFIQPQDLSSQLSSTLIFIGLVVVFQVSIYLMVNKFYERMH